MKHLVVLLFLLMAQLGLANEIDRDLLAIKARMDAVQRFSAAIVLDLDVSFIHMPTKRANVSYEKGKRMMFSSKDFVMLPKRGLDFSLSEIFQYPFITVDRGIEKREGQSVKVIQVIPTDNRSELVLATLYMDTQHKRIVGSEINTRKEGSYQLLMRYATNEDILPAYVEATFEMEQLKIPFNFMGKDTQIDRKEMRALDTKKGKIKMKVENYQVVYG